VDVVVVFVAFVLVSLGIIAPMSSVTSASPSSHGHHHDRCAPRLLMLKRPVCVSPGCSSRSWGFTVWRRSATTAHSKSGTSATRQ
jgi:hypothetical protein